MSRYRALCRHGFRACGLRLRPGMTGRGMRWLARHDRPGEIRTRERRHAVAELLAQVARTPLLDGTLGQIAELERPERHADQPVHRQSEIAEHVLDLAVLAL